ncbi:MAG: shikimate kinase [Oscillospiraceae bacterium]|nr:shikimate kinase [Oscillospiraceae bacterium]
MDKYALIGEHLGHSYSPQIHAMLYENEYTLREVPADGLAEFLQTTDCAAMNVTIPYKKAVIPFCTELDAVAGRIGSVNTLVRRADGWHGYNTDYAGFEYMLRSAGVSPKGKKCVVFGSGGASLTVQTVLADLGAAEIIVVSRSGENNYGNLGRHADAAILVNATPVGMYPNTGAAAGDISALPKLEAVFDLVYNPARTQLLLDAEARGIKAVNGLSMLSAQGVRSAEHFSGRRFDDAKIAEITAALSRQMQNIILVGMPGCGKTTVGRALASALGREMADADDEITKRAGKTVPEIFAEGGEALFRKLETQTLTELGKRSGLVIATGGGCVTRGENYPLLHQNGVIVWLRRALGELPRDGRPLSQAHAPEELWRERRDKYAAFADITVDSAGSAAETAKKVKEALEK